MVQIQNTSLSLQHIVVSVKKGGYVIPMFQRGFVWNISQIESMGDSIIRGYPLSSILTMDINGTLDIAYTALKTFDAIIGDNTEQNISYVLDGQQRITAISKIFLGFDDKREYYFDLLSILHDHFPEDNIGLNSGIYNKLRNDNNQFSPISDSLCRSFAITKEGDSRETRQHNRFISGKAIIENRFGSIITKFLRIFKDIDEKQLDKYMDYLSAMLGSMGGFSILATELPKNSDLDLVVRVFEKVNTTGVKLMLIDLVNAKSFKTKVEKYNKGFAVYVTDNIENIKREHNLPVNIFDKILDFNSKSETYDNLSRVVRTITIAESLQTQHQSKLTNKYMLSKDADFWFMMWDKYSKQLLEFYTWLYKEGMTNIGNMTFYEYVGAIVAEYPKMATNKIFLKSIKKYALYITVSKKGFNRSDLEVFNKFVEQAKYIMDSYEFDKYKFENTPKTPINFTAQDVVEIRGRNNSFEAVKQIIYSENQKGLCSIDLFGNNIKFPNEAGFDEHHIVAKALTKDLRKSIYGSIANITFLDKDANRFDIKEKKISTYMSEIKEILGEEQYHLVLKHNLLDPYYTNPNIDEVELLTLRAKSIAELINSYFS